MNIIIIKNNCSKKKSWNGFYNLSFLLPTASKLHKNSFLCLENACSNKIALPFWIIWDNFFLRLKKLAWSIVYVSQVVSSSK